MSDVESKGPKGISLWNSAISALFGAFAAGATTMLVFQSYIGLPSRVKALEDLTSSQAHLLDSIKNGGFVEIDGLTAEVESAGFIKFDAPLAVYDPKQEDVVITRHSSSADNGEGVFISSYKQGRTGLGNNGTQVWWLRKVTQSDALPDSSPTVRFFRIRGCQTVLVESAVNQGPRGRGWLCSERNDRLKCPSSPAFSIASFRCISTITIRRIFTFWGMMDRKHWSAWETLPC